MKKSLAFLIALFLFPTALMAAEFQVAVASNFTEPAKAIAAVFEKETGHKALLSFGSTGNFYSQIKNGAPFHILFAADTKTPAKLTEEGETSGSPFTYALGALALWSAKENFVDDKGEILKSDKFKFLAVAEPKLAPYGAAAYEVLNAWKLEEALKGKIVTGNNIGQAFQFAESGQAELGFVAWSQVCKDGKLTGGSVWMVPAELYSPIVQDAVVLKAGAENEAAKAFADYISRSFKVRDIIMSYGYHVPQGRPI